MNASKAQSKLPVARIKLALVPVLGLILAWLMFRPTDEPTTDEPLTPTEISSAATSKPAAATSAVQRTWSRANLEDVIAFNPFNPPAKPLPEEAPSTGQNTELTTDDAKSTVGTPVTVAAATRKTVNLQAVYQDARGAVAIVDSRIIRVGDVVDGCRVVEITSEGIVVERE